MDWLKRKLLQEKAFMDYSASAYSDRYPSQNFKEKCFAGSKINVHV